MASKKKKKTEYPASYLDLKVIGCGVKGTPKSLLLISDSNRYLFNCGEGVQRIISEQKLKLNKVSNIFITLNSWNNVGGLLGLALSSRDVESLTVHGPPDAEEILRNTAEGINGSYKNMKKNSNQKDAGESLPKFMPKIIKRNIDDGCYSDINVTIEYIPFFENDLEKGDTEPVFKKNKYCSVDVNSVAYFITPKPKPRKMQIEKLADLNVRVGPWLAKVKSGESVTLDDGRLITPDDILEEAESPRNSVIILEIASELHLLSAVSNEKIYSITNSSKFEENVDVMAHLAPKNIFESIDYQNWIAKMDPNITHLVLNDDGNELVHERIYRMQYKLNMIDGGIFPLLPAQRDFSCNDIDNDNNIVIAHPGMGYFIRSLNTCRRGIHSSDVLNLDKNYMDDCLNESNSNETLISEIANFKKIPYDSDSSYYGIKDDTFPKIHFLGTGSSMPNKVRNVSCILIDLDGSSNLLLDCGEGSIGQIHRFFSNEAETELIKLKVIFISHLHSDHQVGLFGILEKRHNSFTRKGMKPSQLIIICPLKLQSWLDSLSVANNNTDILSSIIFIDVFSLWHDHSSRLSHLDTFQNLVNLRNVTTVKVKHSQYPHGLTIEHNCGWKLTYSGDTRPCEALIEMGLNSNILIHEATMEDVLSEDAKEKNHCTTSEAIDVGKKMNAQFILLTHFSQRYAKVPLIESGWPSNVGIAFDNMCVRPCDLRKLSSMFDVLKLMFCEEHDELTKKNGAYLLRKNASENVDQT